MACSSSERTAHLALEPFLAVFAAGLLTLTALIALFFGVVQALYFQPGQRRRMPTWLIVAVLVLFLILPKIDMAYAQTRHRDKGEQAA